MSNDSTLTLPSDLMEAVDKVVREGLARSRNEFVESAIRRQLANLRRSALDAEFQLMAGDVGYQNDVNQLLGEFAQAEWQTFDVEAPGTDDRGL